jgi:hypothetical protein
MVNPWLKVRGNAGNAEGERAPNEQKKGKHGSGRKTVNVF